MRCSIALGYIVSFIFKEIVRFADVSCVFWCVHFLYNVLPPPWPIRYFTQTWPLLKRSAGEVKHKFTRNKFWCKCQWVLIMWCFIFTRLLFLPEADNTVVTLDPNKFDEKKQKRLHIGDLVAPRPFIRLHKYDPVGYPLGLGSLLIQFRIPTICSSCKKNPM